MNSRLKLVICFLIGSSVSATITYVVLQTHNDSNYTYVGDYQLDETAWRDEIQKTCMKDNPGALSCSANGIPRYPGGRSWPVEKEIEQ
jgi:hypothetical protein